MIDLSRGWAFFTGCISSMVMYREKKGISMKRNLFCVMLVLVFALSACSLRTKENRETKEVIDITDSYGRNVQVPVKVERIAALGNAPRMLVYLGLAEKIVGLPLCEHAKSPIMAYAYVNKELWANLPVIGNDALGAGEWYAEELLACTPDVIVCTYEKEVADDIQNQTGIPVVSLSTPALFSEEYNECFRIAAKACGVSERAEELITYMKDCLKDLRDRSTGIDDSMKPSVLGACATFKGGHSIDGVYANYPLFEVLSAKDVAVGISKEQKGLLVDREQIIEWNPDMIFIDANSLPLLNTDYEEHPEYFQQLKAVKEGEIYQWPNSTWHYSNLEIPLVSGYYVGAMLYPQSFEDVDFEQKASEIFDFFLKKPDYLKTLEEAGAGYGRVTLGGAK